MFSARRKSVSSSNVVGKDVNSTGRTRYSETIRTVTDARMSVTIRRSRMKPGRGVIRAMTIARTAIGTAISRRSSRGRARIQAGLAEAGMALAGVTDLLASFHEFEDVGQDF